MNRRLVIAAWTLIASLGGLPCTAATTGVPDVLSVLERGPNHSVVQRTEMRLDKEGNWSSLTNRCVRLEDGLNYWDS